LGPAEVIWAQRQNYGALILLRGGTEYSFDDKWEVGGKEGSSDWRATWKSLR